MALRAKIGPDEAEAEGFGGSKVEADNEVWPDLRRNPKGWGQFSSFLCRSSLADTGIHPMNCVHGAPVCFTPRF